MAVTSHIGSVFYAAGVIIPIFTRLTAGFRRKRRN